MEQYHIGNKVIDEGKQGEALVLETPNLEKENFILKATVAK